MEISKRKHRKSYFTQTIVATITFVIIVFPLYWMVASSLKLESDIFLSPPQIIPLEPTFIAYIDQFASVVFDIGRGLRNSFIIAGSCMIISSVLAITAAYGLARFQVKGLSIILFLFLISQMLPQSSVLIPNFIIFKKIGIYNTRLAPILATSTIAIPFCILMMRTYFLSIPKEIDDAARIDGCNSFTSFIRVMLPMSASGVAVSLVFSFLFAYSDMIYSLTYVTDSAKWPVTTGIYNAVGRYGIEWSRAMAFGCVVVLPVLIIFLVMQRYVVKGLTAGAVKG